MNGECGLWVLALIPIVIAAIGIIYGIAAIQGKEIE